MKNGKFTFDIVNFVLGVVVGAVFTSLIGHL